MNKNQKTYHYIIGDDMKRLLWNLFNRTGNINYYLLLSRVRSRNAGMSKRNSIK